MGTVLVQCTGWKNKILFHKCFLDVEEKCVGTRKIVIFFPEYKNVTVRSELKFTSNISFPKNLQAII